MAQLLLTEMLSLVSASNKYAIRHTQSFAHQFNYFDTFAVYKIDWFDERLFKKKNEKKDETVINGNCACMRACDIGSKFNSSTSQST